LIQIYDVKLRLSDGVVLLEVCEGDESILIEIIEKVVFKSRDPEQVRVKFAILVVCHHRGHC